MGASFAFFSVNKFPGESGPNDSLFAQGQAELFGKPASTRVTFESAACHGSFEKYRVYHESLRRTRGRTYEGTDFDSFYQKNEFVAYLDRNTNAFCCGTSKSTARSFIETLNKSHADSFNADYLRLDFQKVRPRLEEVNGIWVSRVSQPFLNVMALFGPHVDKSEMYKMAESLGTASSMLISYRLDDTTYPVILSSDYVIAFPTYEPESLYFAIIRRMQEHLFQGAVSNEDSAYNKKKKKQRAADTK